MCFMLLCYMSLYPVHISVLYTKETNLMITFLKILGREGPTVSATPNQLNHNTPDQSNMSLLNLKFKRRKVDSRDSDGKKASNLILRGGWGESGSLPDMRGMGEIRGVKGGGLARVDSGRIC